ncbi:TRAP transporter small permease [Alloyangia pacifica]|uniref:TRAP transporter small permease n=1 Tax=Alloyangia pacifica TaxID=311180 RepID=UPI001CFD9282|nr:TRAP transporter small permease [Alloyangia pacifica]
MWDKLFDTLDRGLARIETVMIAALSLAGLGIGTMQVVLRYVFNMGFEWSEAVFVLCTVTAMLMAGVRAVRDDRHVRVDLVPMLLPEKGMRVIDIISLLASLALCLFYVWCGFLFVRFAKMMGTASPDTGFMDWVVYSIMPVAIALFSIRYILKIRQLALGRTGVKHGLEDAIAGGSGS